ncbi:MAG TPA: sialidase family protein [Phycisphaerae bacterium]|nr:sialidase family protein [Phycisphaerae bacterium]HRY70424.1 sialidase family protein [Phycisphaerae bacterium]HSA28141.1 sialidase family protein [Phycisphaerae bacterium]
MMRLIALMALICIVTGWKANAGLKIEVYDYKSKTIYHSPETPGYTSWVGFWEMPDGTLYCDFRQVTGPKDKTVSTCPLMESKDKGETWKVTTDRQGDGTGSGGIFQMSQNSGRGMAVLKDWTMVRPVWPSGTTSDPSTGYVVRSTDRGKTWSDPIYFLAAADYRCWPTLIKPLKDGRVVLYAGCWKRGVGQPTDMNYPINNMDKVMFVSEDKGKTWSKPIALVPPGEGECEESDFVEMDNGNLFWVHRSEHYPGKEVPIPARGARMGTTPPQSYAWSDRQQSVCKKSGKTFIPGPVEQAPFPHSGYPLVIKTQENLVLHCATDGIYWTSNVGKTWTKLDIPGTAYYPKGMQLKDGRIIIIGHVGGDDAYGTVDQSIFQQSFKLRMVAE